MKQSILHSCLVQGTEQDTLVGMGGSPIIHDMEHPQGSVRAAESSRIEFPQAAHCPASMLSLYGDEERSNNIDSTAIPGKISGYIKIWHDLSGIDDPSWIKTLCLCLLGKHGRSPVSCQQLLWIKSRLNPFINWFSLPGRSTELTLRTFLSKTVLLSRA